MGTNSISSNLNTNVQKNDNSYTLGKAIGIAASIAIGATLIFGGGKHIGQCVKHFASKSKKNLTEFVTNMPKDGTNINGFLYLPIKRKYLKSALEKVKVLDGKPYFKEGEAEELIEMCEGRINGYNQIENYEQKIWAILNNPKEVELSYNYHSKSTAIHEALEIPHGTTFKANPDLWDIKQMRRKIIYEGKTYSVPTAWYPNGDITNDLSRATCWENGRRVIVNLYELYNIKRPENIITDPTKSICTTI